MRDNLYSTAAKKSPVTGFGRGLLKGLLFGMLFLTAGFFLYIIGFNYVGWFCMIFGIILPFIAPLAGAANNIHGECPYCSNDINAIPKNNAIICRTCKNTIIVKDGRLWSI
ncbi:MAG: hypothetical protein N2491_01685 [Negativicutes bacterium]|nr:hypothetical protein [Negativicutes bacterium]